MTETQYQDYLGLLGSFRRFGDAGPVYQVREILSLSSSGELLCRIELPESGEVLDYPASKIVMDPVEI